MDFSLVDGGDVLGTACIGLMTLSFGALSAAGVAWAIVRTSKNLLGPGRAWSPSRLLKWRSSRHWNALAPAHFEGALSDGAVVRLRGLVEAEEVSPAKLSGLPSVACEHALGEQGGGTVASGVTALNFTLRLTDGTLVKVPARVADELGYLKLFDGKPHRWTNDRLKNSWFCESRILPGDEIEVVGRLQRVVDPSTTLPGGRGPAFRWTLHPVKGELPLFFETKPHLTEGLSRSLEDSRANPLQLSSPG